MGDETLESFHLASHEVALHFNAPVSSIYQIEQWIPTLEELNSRVKVAIIVRRKSSFQWLIEHTNFSIIFAHTQNDLVNSYEENNFKCILYVNNGVQNFQSLAYRNALHVHINHGESEKTSTISNQANAYNYLFVVAKAGYDKYRLNLLEKNMQKFIEIGRPQLEHIPKIAPFNTDRKVILYAPTWEGTHKSMNYSSLGEFGIEMVKQIVDSNRFYLVYKPHPNTGFNDKQVKIADEEITAILQKSPYGEVIKSGDINSLYEHINIAIFDNSAIAIDYLAVDKPMIMTDMFYRVKDRQSKPTIIKAAFMLSKERSGDILEIVDRELREDSLKKEREKIKRYFLGDKNYKEGESTEAFISQVMDIMEKRDEALRRLKELNAKESLLDESI
ncbi:putative integral membrane protein [hydrothermal vent metagenome]|uniref:Putative integral membrane protein n=1 Tax=hydrothermal vent metagenome TaxID=652676 RepID=A0A1W1C0M5_9ZZZZ